MAEKKTVSGDAQENDQGGNQDLEDIGREARKQDFSKLVEEADPTGRLAASLRETMAAALPPGTSPAPYVLVAGLVNPITSPSITLLYSNVESALSTIYKFTTVWDRVKLNSVQLIIGAVYVAILTRYLAISLESFRGLILDSFHIIVRSAFALDGRSITLPVKELLFSMLGLSVTGTILMSAYAAVLKHPPSGAAKDILKYTLSFATGVLASYLGSK